MTKNSSARYIGILFGFLILALDIFMSDNYFEARNVGVARDLIMIMLFQLLSVFYLNRLFHIKESRLKFSNGLFAGLKLGLIGIAFYTVAMLFLNAFIFEDNYSPLDSILSCIPRIMASLVLKSLLLVVTCWIVPLYYAVKSKAQNNDILDANLFN